MSCYLEGSDICGEHLFILLGWRLRVLPLLFVFRFLGCIFILSLFGSRVYSYFLGQWRLPWWKFWRRFREDCDPTLGKLNDRCLSTFNASDCVRELLKLNIDGEKLCRLGGIEPRAETLCKLLHFAMEVSEDNTILQVAEGSNQPPPAKKAKVDDTPVRQPYPFSLNSVCVF